jgi:ABC-2 type transport system permease protein
MFQQMVAIVAKELKVLWRDRQALMLLFIMPVFFILVMSFSLEGVFEAGSKGRPIGVLVVDEDKGALVEQTLFDLKRLEGITLIETIDGVTLTRERAEQLIQRGKYPLILLFEKGFSERLCKAPKDSTEEMATVQFVSDPATNLQLLASVKGAVRSVIERRAFLENLTHHLKKEFETSAPGLPALAKDLVNLSAGKQFDRILSGAFSGEEGQAHVLFVSTTPQGFSSGRRPTATEQNVPAYTIFGVFFIVLTLASSFVQEKREGTFQRLLAAPLPPIALLLGKLFPYYLVNLIQIILMFAVGVIFFSIKLGNLPALIVVSLALAAAANGLGLLVAALGKTEAQVEGFSILLAITLAALGGMMVPTFIMPDVMKTISLFTPHAWALTGYHDIIIRGLGLKQIVLEVEVLLGFACLFFVLALWRFKFNG